MRRAEPVAGLGGILLLVSLFLPWYSGVFPGVEGLGGAPGWFSFVPLSADQVPSLTATAWTVFTFTDVLLALLALPAIAVPLVSLTTSGPAKPIAIQVIASAVGWIAVVLVAYRLLNPPGPNEFVTLEYGAWLALAGALMAWVGSWLTMRDESTPGAVPPDMPRRPAPPAHAS